MTAERYTFTGIDQRGQGRGGDVTLGNLAEWVRKKHAAGWTKLRVQHVPTKLDQSGRRVAVPHANWPIVAEISVQDGIRGWWSE